ncbi:protein takeout-like [Cimex lectularius]|uniref:Protein takeout n=1 Tax=Cimex lectularius TaxID=79782 RepID=A0A8I6RL70_CIMLE|nr:protein takeout-like [Cimex lectularius]
MHHWPRFFYLSVLCFLSVSSIDLPEYLHICHRNQPDLAGCIKQSVEDLRPNLIQGIPELGVPPIEPLIIEEPISTKGSGLTVTTKDLKAHGGGNFTILSMAIDIPSYIYKFTIAFDHLKILGNYVVDGKILMIPIKGDGDMICDVYNVEAFVTMHGEQITKDGVNQLHFKAMDVDVNVANGKIVLSNLFGGEKLLGDTINAAINLNFQYFLKELKPIISESLSLFILRSANKICDGLPYDEILPN